MPQTLGIWDILSLLIISHKHISVCVCTSFLISIKFAWTNRLWAELFTYIQFRPAKSCPFTAHQPKCLVYSTAAQFYRAQQLEFLSQRTIFLDFNLFKILILNISSLMIMPNICILRKNIYIWKDGSAISNNCYSCRRLRSDNQHPYYGLQLCINPVPGDLVYSSGIHGYLARKYFTNSHAMQNTHIHWGKKKRKGKYLTCEKIIMIAFEVAKFTWKYRQLWNSQDSLKWSFVSQILFSLFRVSL